MQNEYVRAEGGRKRWMTMRSTIISLSLCLFVGLLGTGCDNSPGTSIRDKDLRIWQNSLSPNGRFRMVIYQHDTGAWGYGRVFWAATGEDVDNLDLSKFTLPEGYRAEGWTDDSELEVSKWQPYYGVRDHREIQDGDLFNGIRVRTVENNSIYELPGYEEPKHGR